VFWFRRLPGSRVGRLNHRGGRRAALGTRPAAAASQTRSRSSRRSTASSRFRSVWLTTSSDDEVEHVARRAVPRVVASVVRVFANGFANERDEIRRIGPDGLDGRSPETQAFPDAPVPVGRARSHSQGGGTGSNPVGGARRKSVDGAGPLTVLACWCWMGVRRQTSDHHQGRVVHAGDSSWIF
jgi:hypothetical protein